MVENTGFEPAVGLVRFGRWPKVLLLYFSLAVNIEKKRKASAANRLQTYLVTGKVTPERRCSSHTFRYGYLVTT